MQPTYPTSELDIMVSDHIIRQIADTTNQSELDSLREDQILEDWVSQRKQDEIDIFTTYKGYYPPVSRLEDFIVLMKEVPLANYRIDCIAYWRKSGWKLIEVKEQSGLGPSVIGDLVVKSEIFEGTFTVNPERIERIILADRIPDNYRELVSRIDTKYDLGINLRDLD